MIRLHLFPWCQQLTSRRLSSLDRAISRNDVTPYISRARFANSTHFKYNIFRTISSFKDTQHYFTTTSLADKNIFKSMVPNITNFHELYIHELVWKNAAKWWSKTALVCAKTGKSYTYEQLRRLSGKFATSLRKNNIRPGDTIPAILPNVPEFAIVLMGASEAGVQVTLVNFAYTAREIKKQLNDSDAMAVITICAKYPVVTESICGNAAIRFPIIVIQDETGSVGSGVINFKDLVADAIDEFEKTGEKTERDPEFDTFLLPFSSGTSGLPKGVELTHRNLVANVNQFKAKELCVSEEATSNFQEIQPLFLPIFHIYGFTCCLISYLCLGAKVICMPQFSSVDLLHVMEKNKVTTLYVAPPIVQLIANDVRFTLRHIENLNLVMSGAARLKEELIAKFLDRCGSHFIFVQGYGLTETSPVISKSKKAPPASSGVIVPNTEVRIVGYEKENEGKDLGPNECGHIFVRGPQVMKGYLKNSQATQECMEGEWCKTGDLGLIDNEGFLYVQGRLKELIEVQGFQVAPAELEGIIQGHKKIADVAVIGVPHDKYGEIPKAFVVPKSNMQFDAQEIKDFVAQRAVKYKHLGHVVIIDKIPKSASGKILRRELQKI